MTDRKPVPGEARIQRLQPKRRTMQEMVGKQIAIRRERRRVRERLKFAAHVESGEDGLAFLDEE